jgi:hypothetical protein
MKNCICWDVKACGPSKANWGFRGTCRFHLQGRRMRQVRNHRATRSNQSLSCFMLTSLNGDLLEKLPVVQLLKNLKVYYSVHKIPPLIHIISWARSVHSIPPHPIALQSILILFTHLLLGLPSRLITSVFPVSILFYRPRHSWSGYSLASHRGGPVSRPGLTSGIRGGQIGIGAGFLLVLRSPLPKPFSILTITRGRHTEALRQADHPSKESCWMS